MGHPGLWVTKKSQGQAFGGSDDRRAPRCAVEQSKLGVETECAKEREEPIVASLAPPKPRWFPSVLRWALEQRNDRTWTAESRDRDGCAPRTAVSQRGSNSLSGRARGSQDVPQFSFHIDCC
ncbi:hypothetical protein CPLU01_01847 [Colletotrichum plurivorum]|uniref:Uncharacterized protein n=1 Tax=Colletotrichum plurivorum TaxID=2175906 RepID=A0A8H6KXD2_9PEZI|nr:hypothetical protein CPLU01_01847 [Colletotrichum plurivorum]